MIGRFQPEPVAELVDVLLESLLALGEAGEVDRANRLAGSAYMHLRRRNPVQAQRINVIMHRLAAREPAGIQPPTEKAAPSVQYAEPNG